MGGGESEKPVCAVTAMTVNSFGCLIARHLLPGDVALLFNSATIAIILHVATVAV